jgi:hypothetical protein
MNEDILELAKEYITNQGNSPTLIVGRDGNNNFLPLIGTFRDFEEQITFCAITKMSFYFNKIKEYYVITHGIMKDQLNPEQITAAKSNLMRFLRKEKDIYVNINNAEVLIITKISKDKECTVYKIKRNNTDNKIDTLYDVLNFKSSDLIDGMFLELLPKRGYKLSSEIKSKLDSFIDCIKYDNKSGI